MDWFLDYRDHRHEKVKKFEKKKWLLSLALMWTSEAEIMKHNLEKKWNSLPWSDNQVCNRWTGFMVSVWPLVYLHLYPTRMSPFKMLTILGFIQGLMTQLFKLRLKIAKAKAAGVLYKKSSQKFRKEETLAQVFSMWILWNFQENLFSRAPADGCFDNSKTRFFCNILWGKAKSLVLIHC